MLNDVNIVYWIQKNIHCALSPWQVRGHSKGRGVLKLPYKENVSHVSGGWVGEGPRGGGGEFQSRKTFSGGKGYGYFMEQCKIQGFYTLMA